MLTTSFLRQLEITLGKTLKQKLHIKRVTPVSGGSINLTARIATTSGNYFLKANDAFRYPLMFEKEANGLKTLKAAGVISVPDVIMTGEEDGQAFIIMTYFDEKPKSAGFWRKFGQALAELHKNTSEKFGFTEDNYIGSLEQSNLNHNKWTDFFIEERIEKQLQLAMRNGLLNNNDQNHFKKLYPYYESMMQIEQPSLLHGDLWSGNFITDSNGNPCIIDPAVYYGHREMDIAMTKLFGGFDAEFYDAYNERFPLPPGFEERTDIHNLYPLLVHVNLFKGSYIEQVRRIIKKF